MQLSDAEWTVMNVLWSAAPRRVRDVLDALPPEREWAYTTVKTILTRLADKGAVVMTKDGNVSQFSPLVTRRKARRTALRSLLDRAFDGAFGALIHHVVDDERMSAGDRRRLREMLEEDDEAGIDTNSTTKKTGRRPRRRS